MVAIAKQVASIIAQCNTISETCLPNGKPLLRDKLRELLPSVVNTALKRNDADQCLFHATSMEMSMHVERWMSKDNNYHADTMQSGGTGGGNLGEMGTGSLQEVGEEGAGGGGREKWEKFRNIGIIFRNRKSTQRWKLLRKGREPGVQGAGGKMFRPPCRGVPPPPQCT